MTISAAGWRAGVASLVLLLAPAFALAQAQPAPVAQQLAIISDFDRVHPAFGAQGMAATQEEMATRAGLEVLRTAATRSMPPPRSRSSWRSPCRARATSAAAASW